MLHCVFKVQLRRYFQILIFEIQIYIDFIQEIYELNLYKCYRKVQIYANCHFEHVQGIIDCPAIILHV